MREFELKPAADLGLALRERLRSPKREGGLIETAGHLFWGVATRAYLRLWHRLEVHGREHLPAAPPFVLVANHTSHLDVLVLAAPLRLAIRDRVFPLAAGDVFFESRVTSVFAATFLNAIPMWRRRSAPRAMQDLRRRLLDEPCGYIIFPEGGRSRDGICTSFKPGVGMLVAETEAPIIPCHLRGCFDAMPAGVRFPRPRKIVLRIGPPLRFPNVANDRAGWQTIIGQVEASVRGLA